jgi:hypothetical protein
VTASWSIVRVARLVALSIVIGWSIANAIQRIGDWSLSDMDAYWNAALRLRQGWPLYPAVANSGAADVFRYAPWFAWAWVPLTFLPKMAVAIGWSALLVAATAASIRPILARPTLTTTGASLLLGSILLWSAASGNVQPLIVAALVRTVEKRSGPVWIGIASSLKIFPLGFALVYAGRRQWRRLLLAVGIAILLWLPSLAYDLGEYQRGFLDSPNPLLLTSPLMYGGVLAAATIITLAVAHTRFSWIAAAITVVAAIPRVSLIELTYLAVGAPSRSAHGTMGLRDATARSATVPHDLARQSQPSPEEPSSE